MIAYIVRRMLLSLFTVFVVSFISFVIIQLPEGDAVDQLANTLEFGDGLPALSTVDTLRLREEWGLNRPLVLQWSNWIYRIVRHGDFGRSYTGVIGNQAMGAIKGSGIAEAIRDKLPYTIYLAVFTTIISMMISIPIGIYSAVRIHSLGDYVFTFAGFAGLAVPDFLLGLVAMYISFAYFNHSVGGLFSGDYINAPWSVGRVLDMLQHLIIPCLVLATAGTAGGIRIMRNNLIDELNKPYVVTARAKGLPGWRVVVKYPLRVAINPFISGIGGTLPALVSGSAIISIVLALPTIGPMLLDATFTQDGPLLGAGILMMTVLSVVGVLISDIMLVVVDPRIKLTGSARGSGEGV